MRLVLLLLAGLALASCGAPNTAPTYTGPDYQETGFAAYCAANPHVGVCP